jgi:ABC-type nitrate/sulfonate/bicarbonate transport system permease component
MSVQASKADTGLVRDGQGWRVAQKIRWRVEPVVRRSAAIVIFLLLWELAARLGLINQTFLPQRDRVSGAGAAA